jgi:HAD superfamily hydrolase (TIGR01549 family)
VSTAIAVGFDFDHTLGIDNKLERTVALALLADLAAKNGLAYSVADAEVAIDEVLRSYRESDRSIDSFIAGFFERFAPAGAAVMDEASGFREAVVAAAPNHIEALPGAQETLAELERLGIPYALLTNGWSPLQEEKARLIGFRGPVFVSERIAARKPSREAFAMLAKHFELPFERIWYVGDDPAIDCAGARNVGLTAVWFDWESRPYPAELAPPDHVIHALEQLPGLLIANRGAPCA